MNFSLMNYLFKSWTWLVAIIKVLMFLGKGMNQSVQLTPNMVEYYGRLSSLVLLRQPVEEKNSELKTLQIKMNVVSNSTHSNEFE